MPSNSCLGNNRRRGREIREKRHALRIDPERDCVEAQEDRSPFPAARLFYGTSNLPPPAPRISRMCLSPSCCSPQQSALHVCTETSSRARLRWTGDCRLPALLDCDARVHLKCLHEHSRVELRGARSDVSESAHEGRDDAGLHQNGASVGLGQDGKEQAKRAANPEQALLIRSALWAPVLGDRTFHRGRRLPGRSGGQRGRRAGRGGRRTGSEGWSE